MEKQTLLQHPATVPLQPWNRSVVPPIYQTVKFTVDKYEQLQTSDIFVYTRVSNPTVRELELQLATLQGCEDAIAVASGCASLSIPLLSLLRQGDHVLLFAESYPPIRYLIQNLLRRFGVESTMISHNEPKVLEAAIRPNTKLIAFESPTNPMTHIADIDLIVKTARQRGILTMMDNTFAGPLNHGGLGIDLLCHSLTKFVSGHGDVMGGMILGKAELLKSIRLDAMEIGPVLDPSAAALISRGLKTYIVRRERQCETAQRLASWLESHQGIEKVWYPGLESHPGHDRAKKYMGDFGAVIAIDLKRRTISEFFNSLSIFTLAASLGSCESLAAPAEDFYGRDLPPEVRRAAGISPASVRLSIGLEAFEDLANALDRALDGSLDGAL
jgi:cystathionine beta-lyase/cystathionine gamma-synthase